MPPVLANLIVQLGVKIIEGVLLRRQKARMMRWIVFLALILVAALGTSIAALVIALRSD